MIAIILYLIAEKNRVWKMNLFHLSPIAMLAGHLPDGLLHSIRVKVFLSKNLSP